MSPLAQTLAIVGPIRGPGGTFSCQHAVRSPAVLPHSSGAPRATSAYKEGMCFSATGSFLASGVLGAIGVAATRRNTSKAHRMFAAIPLLFAVQQAAEGVVWLTLGGYAGLELQQPAVMVFLGFALVVWPTWVPLSLWSIERLEARRRLLRFFVAAGVGVSLIAAVLLVRWGPVPQVVQHSIRYVDTADVISFSPLFMLAVYAIPTVAAFFFASVSLARLTGLALFFSLLLAIVIERDALTSVWCFFAAVLSGLVMLAVAREQLLLSSPVALEQH